MVNSIHLTSLSPCEGAADALYRCVAGIDLNDREMFTSAWFDAEDVSFDMDGKVTTGMDGLCDGLLGFIGALETQHMISNVRVNLLDGGKAASLTAYGLATHYRPGEGLDTGSQALTSGSQYFVDVEREDENGLWKMRKWRMHIIWLDGDGSIVGM